MNKRAFSKLEFQNEPRCIEHHGIVILSNKLFDLEQNRRACEQAVHGRDISCATSPTILPWQLHSCKCFSNNFKSWKLWFISFFVKWNDKITTLPGLYLLSTGLIRIIGLIVHEADILTICTLYNLRLFNVFLSTLNYIVVYKILQFNKNKKLNTATENVSL